MTTHFGALVFAVVVAIAGIAWHVATRLPVEPAQATRPGARTDETLTATSHPPAPDIVSPTSAQAARPSDIPGEVSYRPVNTEYPRAFETITTVEQPTGPALDALQSAEVALQRGNAHAGYAMYMAIARCQDEAITNRMRELQKAENDAAHYELLLSGGETALRECQGVGPAEIARGYDGLKTAAERGDITAQLYYPAVGAAQFSTSTTEMLRNAEKLSRFREDSMRFLHAAAARGSIQALQKLARAYRNGTITDRSMQRSYVYTYAVYLLMPNATTESLVAGAAESLSADQIGAAQIEARGILDRCCR